jgi:putative peptidoglycan lipid II flippase
VGAGIFFSRISGFIRSVLLAAFFGASGLMDVWVAATKIPNVIQNLLGEGTLSASVIPVYAEFLEEGREEEAGRFAGAVLGILMVVAGGAALLGMLLAPVFVPIAFFRWDPEKLALTTLIIQILFPMTAVLVVSAWALAILNSHRRFLVSYLAPVAWNGAIIATLVAVGFGLGWSGRQLLLATALGPGRCEHRQPARRHRRRIPRGGSTGRSGLRADAVPASDFTLRNGDRGVRTS